MHPGAAAIALTRDRRQSSSSGDCRNTIHAVLTIRFFFRVRFAKLASAAILNAEGLEREGAPSCALSNTTVVLLSHDEREDP